MPTPSELDGALAVNAPLIGTVVSVLVAAGDAVRAGQAVVILESMKMEHLVEAEVSGVVAALAVGAGDTVEVDQTLLWLTEGEVHTAAEVGVKQIDLDLVRPDLAEVVLRQAATKDAARADAVERHHRIGHRSARENVEDVCDPGTFVEYGSLTVAAQRRRRTVADLIARTPADGMVAGVGHVNGDRFGEDRSRCVVMSYDYTVLAGTQGHFNHL
jgi:pyruvate/2-oxoglutarate dehydrogenase complex dihydrolipoamide acyltransferase (E2) component